MGNNVSCQRNSTGRLAMAVHDWSRVSAGLFHHFHLNWISALCTHLNSGSFGLLRSRRTGRQRPDSGCHYSETQTPADSATESTGGIALAVSPPRTRYIVRAEADPYLTGSIGWRFATRRNWISIIEIVSPGNKGSQGGNYKIRRQSCPLYQTGYSRAGNRRVAANTPRSAGNSQSDLGRDRRQAI